MVLFICLDVMRVGSCLKCSLRPLAVERGVKGEKGGIKERRGEIKGPGERERQWRKRRGERRRKCPFNVGNRLMPMNSNIDGSFQMFLNDSEHRCKGGC